MTHQHTPVDDGHAQLEAAPVVSHAAVVDTGPTPGTLIRRIVVLLFGILQTLLILRVVLMLLGANEGNQLVSLVLTLTDPFIAPFEGMFDIDRASAGDSQLDVAALVALVGWTLIEALVLAILGLADRRRRVVA